MIAFEVTAVPVEHIEVGRNGFGAGIFETAAEETALRPRHAGVEEGVNPSGSGRSQFQGVVSCRRVGGYRNASLRIELPVAQLPLHCGGVFEAAGRHVAGNFFKGVIRTEVGRLRDLFEAGELLPADDIDDFRRTQRPVFSGGAGEFHLASVEIVDGIDFAFEFPGRCSGGPAENSQNASVGAAEAVAEIKRSLRHLSGVAIAFAQHRLGERECRQRRNRRKRLVRKKKSSPKLKYFSNPSSMNQN